MDTIPGYYVLLEQTLMGLLGRVVSRPRTTLLDPPVPLELIQHDLEKFRKHSALHIEQAARGCVYRIAVRILLSTSSALITGRIRSEKVSPPTDLEMESNSTDLPNLRWHTLTTFSIFSYYSLKIVLPGNSSW
jgi:hypothetical protein